MAGGKIQTRKRRRRRSGQGEEEGLEGRKVPGEEGSAGSTGSGSKAGEGEEEEGGQGLAGPEFKDGEVENTGRFKGQKRIDVRYSVSNELTKLGLFVKKEDNPIKVPMCQRSKDIMKPQCAGLWPMSTLGWPNDTLDFQKPFPVTVLQMGGTGFFGGSLMSKSLGNVVDPIDIVEGVTFQQLNDKLRSGKLDPKELKTAEKYQNTAFP
ncbi:hypothetical protein K505DRAFT_341285 [Melanomma pulvis-pyrius CBS 109.77]|uniref:valine--tRNA ligase n=1 Tax=Melanomma pulvis-pyrius CBS 109.77 TaxID=1314802 RepID=A0A6A6WZA8_9PLEO|nr:hypothetical protein K505DRAFT_341285 [Melanomma pulvis-pyrius CBS 109.77]